MCFWNEFPDCPQFHMVEQSCCAQSQGLSEETKLYDECREYRYGPPAQRTILTWSKISLNEYSEDLECLSLTVSLCRGELFRNIDMVSGHLGHLGKKVPNKGHTFSAWLVSPTTQQTRKKMCHGPLLVNMEEHFQPN